MADVSVKGRIRDWYGTAKKLVRFAVLGAIGCWLGALLGEALLALTRNAGLAVPPQAICLVVDCSGSMDLFNGPQDTGMKKLTEVKQAATAFVGRQDLKRDMIAVIGFGSGVHVGASLSQDPKELELAVMRIADGGSTAMDNALATAFTELLRPNRSGGNAHLARAILLFTDGQPDNPASALAQAESCRQRGIKLVAIGTGDADTAYLNQITGDPKLVFRANAGNFGESFKQAEKAIRSLVESSATGTEFTWRVSVARIAGWTALLAVGVALALIMGQNQYLHRPLLTGREASIGIAGGLIAGLMAGAAGQLLFLGTASVLQGAVVGSVFDALGRIVGWTILGALVGWGLAFFVPNLHARLAFVGGGIGGAAAATAFLVVSVLGEVLARWLGAAILGALLGTLLALVEAVFRQVWLEVRAGREVITVSLGATPVKIGSNNRACTIYARDTRSLAAQYQVVDGKVMYLDFATERNTEVTPGDERTIGHLTVTVRSSTRANAGPVAASPVAAAAPPVPKAKTDMAPGTAPPPPLTSDGSWPSVMAVLPPPPPVPSAPPIPLQQPLSAPAGSAAPAPPGVPKIPAPPPVPLPPSPGPKPGAAPGAAPRLTAPPLPTPKTPIRPPPPPESDEPGDHL